MRTSNILSFAVLALLSPSAAHAQLFEDWGIKIGVTSSFIMHTNTTAPNPWDPGTGFMVHSVNPSITACVTILKFEYLNLESEVTYLRYGASQTLLSSYEIEGRLIVNEPFTIEIGLQYLQIAVNAQPKIQLGDLTTYAIVGLTGKHLLETTNLAYLALQSYPAGPNRVNDTQFGYNLGVGLDFRKLIAMDIFVEFTYSTDLRSFYELTNFKFWNRASMLVVGTRF